MRSIEAQKFLSYETLEFEFNKGLCLIEGINRDEEGGSNGAGKSSLMNAICYALFGSLPTSIKADDVINVNSDNGCTVELLLENNSTSYKIIRGRKPNIIRFYVNDEEKNDIDSKKTQSLIEKTLNINFDIFINSVYFSQNSQSFLHLNDASKKEMLTNILNLNVFDSANEIVKSTIRQQEDAILEYSANVKLLDSNKIQLSDQVSSLLSHLNGFDLAQKWESHLLNYKDTIDIKIGVKVIAIEKKEKDDSFVFNVKASDGQVYESETVILAVGARRRRLNVLGEEKFEGKGVVYCSTCDAPIFSGKKVVVIGGGNAGLEAVQDLAPYASEITLLEGGAVLKGDPVTQEAIKKIPQLKETIFGAEILEVVGGEFVTGLRYRLKADNQEKLLPVDGIFVEIGSVPNSEMVKGLADLNARGEVVIDSKMGTTSQPGLFAAGDITDDPYKQNNISAGDGVKAALAAYQFLLKK